MELWRAYRDTAEQARGVTVVIDVIRAFTVAANAFAGGAREMWLVRTVEEARALREGGAEGGDALLVGEVTGRLIPGFDANNSPARMAAMDVRGRLLIQRTGAGTQGAVGAVNASRLLVCALVNARATATYARQLAERGGEPITLLPTASFEGVATRNEDDICADYLDALLHERADARRRLDADLEELRAAGRFHIFEGDTPDFPAADLPAVLAIDAFSFAMEGERRRWRDIEYVALRRVEVAQERE